MTFLKEEMVEEMTQKAIDFLPWCVDIKWEYGALTPNQSGVLHVAARAQKSKGHNLQSGLKGER